MLKLGHFGKWIRST